MEIEYVVKKQFALESAIYNEGDVVAMTEADAKSFLDEGTLAPHVEEKVVNVEVDSKGIQEAIEAGFARFAPVAAPEKKMGFGDFLQGIAKKTINITTGNQGGNATNNFLDPQFDVDLIRESGIASRAQMVPLSGQNNVYTFNVVSSIGTAPAVVAESGTVSASQPVITNFSISLQKLMYRMDVTEEALQDTGALAAEVASTIPEEFSKYIENGMINGAGPFTAIVGDSNTVTVAKETGQTIGTIVVENVDKMYSSAKSPARCVWVMSRSAYSGIQGLEDTEGQRIFQGPNGLGDAPFGTLKGLPIVVSDYAQAIGTVGDILLCDFRKYKIASKGGLDVMSSEHVSFLEDETVFKFRYRVGGLPFGILLTATDGTEIGDFVELASRIS